MQGIITIFFSMQDEHVRIAFEYFDHGNSGVISKNDLEEIFNNEVVYIECSPIYDRHHCLHHFRVAFY